MSAVAERTRARADALRERAAARLAAVLPGATVEREGERLVVTGRGVIERFVGADGLRDWREDDR